MTVTTASVLRMWRGGLCAREVAAATRLGLCVVRGIVAGATGQDPDAFTRTGA